MQKEFITTNFEQTQKLGEILATEFEKGGIVCLFGELGAGKTTFTQGLLKGLGAKGPYTSPTFVVMKEYKIKDPKSSASTRGNDRSSTRDGKIKNIYHIDAYRVEAQDVLALGWEEMFGNKNNVIVVEWAERIYDIIPKDALQINFEWINENERKIIFKSNS